MWRAALLPFALLVEAVFQILGMILVPIAALGAYEYRPSTKYADRYVRSWNWPWMYVFGNEEDGIDGQPLIAVGLTPFRNAEWRRKTLRWSTWRRIVTWAALRNGASNLRFTRWGIKIDPRKVRVHYWNTGRGTWFVSHGWRSNFRHQGPRWRFWIGWNVGPWDVLGLLPSDPRSAGVGFKFQFKRAR